MEKIGYEAAALLDSLMAGESDQPQITRIPPRGVEVRASSDAIAVAEPRVREAVEFIRTHLHEPIGIADLLDQIPVSRRWLEYEFKRRIGMTPFHYLLEERIKLARRLLLETDLAIKEIAVRVGYRQHRHFSTAFKRHTGQPPIAVRQANARR